jgi:hypothetical protein
MGDEREGSYANSREEQSKFEGLVREEGDWQDAVEDVVEGEEPDEEQPPAAAGALLAKPRRVHRRTTLFGCP